MELFGSLIGIAGTLCFLSAYFLLQYGKLLHTGLAYLGLNLAGAILLMISLSIDWNLPAFLLEAAWALISIYGIYKYHSTKS
ncbi:MAG: hypothetical protein SFT92_00720 [Rickettsiales bacterium]|nr:hypothetical protein [Rickettsiales bacterium]